MSEQLTKAIEEVVELNSDYKNAEGITKDMFRAELSQAIKDLSRINTLEGGGINGTSRH